MSDLQEKFTTLETQLATQHAELMAALAAIGDTSSNMAAVNLTLVAMLEQDAQFYSAALGQLGLISTNLETLLNNSSLNTQRILAMILATACPCDDITPLPPPLLPDPISAEDQEKCARIQFFVDLFFVWVVDLGTYLSSGGISNIHINTLLANLLQSEDITTGELAAGIPQYVRDSIMHLIANIDTTILALSHDLINTSDSEVKTPLIEALYSVDNAVSGKEAFYNAIDMLELPEDIQNILKTMFYSAWPNDIYSSVPIVDTSEFDGTICASIEPAPCDMLVNSTFAGLESDTDTWDGWEEYHLFVSLTLGAISTTVYIDGTPTEYPAIDPHMVFTGASIRIVFAHPDGAEGTYRLEGCPSRWGGS